MGYNFPIPTNQWTMDNVSGNDIIDEAGTTIVSSAENTDNLTSSPVTLTNSGMTFGAGKFSNAALSGGSSAVRITTPTIAFKTLCMWIRRTDTSNVSLICYSTALRLFGIHNTSDLVYFFVDSGPEYTSITVNDTNWHFVALREGTDNNKHEVMVDGVWHSEELTTNFAGEINGLGRPDSASGQENVDVDNVLVYDSILTDIEVQRIAESVSQFPMLEFDPAIVDNTKKLNLELDTSSISTELVDFPLTVHLDGANTLHKKFFDELTDVVFSDDFNIADGAYDASKWEDVVTGGSIGTSRAQIDSNKLDCYINSSSALGYFDVYGKQVVSGDFSVTVDFDTFYSDDIDSSYVGIKISGLTNSVQIVAIKSTGFRTWSGGGYTNTSRTNDYGSLRIERVGTTINLYKKDGVEDWVLTRTDTDTEDDITFSIRAYAARSYTIISAFLDNFEVVQDIEHRNLAITQNDVQCPVEIESFGNVLNQFTYADTDPIAHWTMDNISGSTLVDEMGSYDGTISNMTQDSDGMFNKALYGGATGSAQHSVSLGSIAFKTISVWLKRGDLTKYFRFMYNVDKSISIATSASGTPNALYTYDGSTVSFTSSIVGDTSNYHHVVIQEGSDSNNHYLWLDGVRTTLEHATNFGGVIEGLGWYVTDSSSDVGLIDNIQVYDYVLTDEEIQKLYISKLPSATLHTKLPLVLPPVGTQIQIPQLEGFNYEETVNNTELYQGNAFGGVPATYPDDWSADIAVWYAGDGVGGYKSTGYVGKDYGDGNAKRVTGKYRLYLRGNTELWNPRNWTLQGSNDGSIWHDLHSVTDWDHTQTEGWYEYTFTNANDYRFVRINVTQNWGDALYLVIAELEFYTAITTEVADPVLSFDASQPNNNNVGYTGGAVENALIFIANSLTAYGAPASYNRRAVIDSLSFVPMARNIKITFGHAGTDYTLTDVYIWKQASSGDAWDGEAGTAVQVTFDGSNTTTISSSNRVSDSINFSVADGDSVVICWFQDASGMAYISGYMPTNCDLYWKVDTVSDSETGDVSGYTAGSSWVNVEKIEYESPAEAVWDDNFVAVYHMAQDPSVSDILDSTSNKYDLTPSLLDETNLIDGISGKAISYTGTEYTALDLGILSSFPLTLETIATLDSGAEGTYVHLCDKDVADQQIGISPAGGYATAFNYSGTYYEAKGTVPLDSNFSHIAGVYVDATNKYVITNGADKQTLSTSCSFPTNVDRLSIGRAGDSTPGNYTVGAIDEVRISNIVRSADWISTTNDSLRDNIITWSQALLGEDSFQFTVTLPAQSSTLYEFLIPLYLNSTSGTGDLDVSAIFTELGDDWDKLIIRQGTTQLYTEVKMWDPTSGKAVLFVRGTIFTSDSEITIDYRSTNATQTDYIGIAGSTAAETVWNSSFDAAYNMSHDPGGTAPQILDSTGNGNDGTAWGTLDTADLIDGEYGSALFVDGGTDYVGMTNMTATGDWTFITLIKPIITSSGDGIFVAAGDGLVFAGGYNAVLNASNVTIAGSVTTPDEYVVLAGTSNNQIFEDGVDVSQAYSNSNWALNGVTRIANGYDNRKPSMEVAFVAKMSVDLADDSIALLSNLLKDNSVSWEKVPNTPPVESSAIYAYLDLNYGVQIGRFTGHTLLLYIIQSNYISYIEQVYSSKLGGHINQYYGNAYVFTNFLNTYYSDGKILSSYMDMDYGDGKLLLSYIEQFYSISPVFQNYIDQLYHLAGKPVVSFEELMYTLKGNSEYRNFLEEFFSLHAETFVETSDLTVTIDGIRVYPEHVNFEFNRDSYKAYAEVHIVDEAAYLAIKPNASELRIQDTDVDLYFQIEIPRESNTIGSTSYVVPAESKSRVLERAESFTEEFTGGMVSDLVKEIALRYDITVIWGYEDEPKSVRPYELTDYYLPAGELYANEETPLTVIKKITNQLGVLLQPTYEGNIRVVRNMDVNSDKWDDSGSTPSYYLTHQRNFFEVSESGDDKKGYNSYNISDYQLGEDRVWLESEDVSSTTKTVKAYKVPFNNKDLDLFTSGGSDIVIDYHESSYETLTEEIEIVQGEGSVSKPIYEKVSQTYKDNTILGNATYNEDGSITTDVEGQSLLTITYKTKYYKWTVKSTEIEKVQFWVSEKDG